MDLAFTAEERKFADEVRAFVKANLPADVRDKVKNGKHLDRDDYMRWQQALGKKGWLVYTWPRKHGGPGFTPAERYIFENVCAEEYAPGIIPFGTKMVGPVIYTFGTDEQKQKFLPAIRESTVWWCQGYSEPGSGSDLASLRTKAEKQGDHYIVNGSKTWNTMGHWADWIFCLVRTDSAEKKQEGISFLLIDMKSPGITVRPLILMDGGHEVNEVFFDEVKVPVANLVHEEGKGWTVAKYLLGHERMNTARIGGSRRELEKLKEFASRQPKNGRSLMEDVRFRDKVTRVEVELMALEITNLRFLDQLRGGRAAGADVSMLKIRGTEIQQALTELMMEAAGPLAQPFRAVDPAADFDAIMAGIAPRYCNFRKTSIYAGSNEIQRNIIAKMSLGL